MTKIELTEQAKGVLPVLNGGTNASTIEQARTNLGVPSGSGSSSGVNTGDETATTIGELVTTSTNKISPQAGDLITMVDATSGDVNKITWVNARTALEQYFDTVYSPLTFAGGAFLFGGVINYAPALTGYIGTSGTSTYAGLINAAPALTGYIGTSGTYIYSSII